MKIISNLSKRLSIACETIKSLGNIILQQNTVQDKCPYVDGTFSYRR